VHFLALSPPYDRNHTDHSAKVKIWSLASRRCTQEFDFTFEGPVVTVKWIIFQDDDNASSMAGFVVGTSGGFIILGKFDRDTVSGLVGKN
jgi:hypothetical protein